MLIRIEHANVTTWFIGMSTNLTVADGSKLALVAGVSDLTYEDSPIVIELSVGLATLDTSLSVRFEGSCSTMFDSSSFTSN